MSGLIYKNFRINRSSFAFSLITAALCCVTAILLSIFVGGADGVQDEAHAANISMVFGVLYYLGFMLPALTTSMLFEADENKTACAFAMSCPQGGKGHIEAKYYYLLLLNLAMFFLSFITDAVTTTIFGGKVCMASALMLIFCVRLFLAAIEVPFVIRFGSQRGVAIKGLVVMFIFMIALIYFLFGDISWLIENENDPVGAFMTWLGSGDMVFRLGLFPFVAVTAYYLSCKISVRLFRKGAENYEQ